MLEESKMNNPTKFNKKDCSFCRNNIKKGISIIKEKGLL